MTSTNNKIFIVLLLLFATFQVSADWTGCKLFDGDCVDYEIGDIFSAVKNTNNNLNGLTNNTVLKDFRLQRELWRPYKGNTPLMADGVQDILESLPALREEFIGFIGSREDKCSYDSKCYYFREELIELFTGLNELKSKFPAFEKAGLVETGVAEEAIVATPPFILFGMYKVMNRLPGWRDLPSDLSDIFDEIDDPEIFSLSLIDDNSEAVNPGLFASMDALDIPAIRDSTKTQRFCALRANKFDGVGRGLNGNRDGWDQIRVNRIILVVTLLTDIYKHALGLIPDDIDLGVAILGEGATLGIPRALFTAYLEAIPLAIESILKAIDVYHNNIGLCKARFSEIESRLSSCGYFTEFVLDGTAQGEYYKLVNRRFEMADEAMVSHAKSDALYDKSVNLLNKGRYARAYKGLCKSYSSIGIKK
jgi:hypothetical protein